MSTHVSQCIEGSFTLLTYTNTEMLPCASVLQVMHEEISNEPCSQI